MSNKILLTTRIFQVILQYRQIAKGVILNKTSECSSRNPSAGEKVILKCVQKSLPIEVINRKPSEFLPTLSCSHHIYCSPISSLSTGNHSREQRKQHLANLLSRVRFNRPLPTSTFEWPSKFLWE